MSSTAARRKIGSPSVGHHDDYRQIDVNFGQSSIASSSSSASSNVSERKSVFDRLGPAPITRTTETRRVVSQCEECPEFRVQVKSGHSVGRKQLSPPSVASVVSSSGLASSPLPQVAALFQRQVHKEDNKVKSLVMTPNAKISPVRNAREKKELRNLKGKLKSPEELIYINDDDVDDEELKLRLRQLQRELRELDGTERNDVKNSAEKASSLLSIVSNSCDHRSGSSSIISSRSASCDSVKTKSSCSNISDKKVDQRTLNQKALSGRDKIKPLKVHHQQISSGTNNSSSSNIRKLDTVYSDVKRSGEVKLDRHGNVRVSLVEQERQKRLRAERFRLSPVKERRKRSADHFENYKSSSRNRSSLSPPAKRSKETLNERKSDRHRRDTQDSHKNDSRSSEIRKDDYYYKRSDSLSVKYENSRHSPSSHHSNRYDYEQTKIRKSKFCDDRSRDKEVDRHYYGEKRDHHLDSHDRDHLSVNHERRRPATGDKPYSREQSPAHSRFSRASSFASDRSSRPSQHSKIYVKSERTLQLSADEKLLNDQSAVSSQMFDVIVSRTEEPIIDEMSPISANSSLPEVGEIDSNSSRRDLKELDDESQDEKSLNQNDMKKNEDGCGSDATFSDWSDAEDELLLQNDVEPLDNENLSEPVQEKSAWSDNVKDRRDSFDALSPPRDDADALEAISDDELDAIIGESEPVDIAAENQQSTSQQQMLDALEIDWKSLISDNRSKPKFVPGSVRTHFSPANVLSRIGFSQAFAGPQLTNKIIDYCQSQLRDDFTSFRHPIATVHALINDRIKERCFVSGEATISSCLSRKDFRKCLSKANLKPFESANSASSPSLGCTSQQQPLLMPSSSLPSSTNNNQANNDCVIASITSPRDCNGIAFVQC